MKKETYLRSLLAFLLLMVGANLNYAWGEDEVIKLTPSADTQLRLDNEMAVNTAEIELHKQSSSGQFNYDFSGLLQFNLSDVKTKLSAGYTIKSATLRLTNSTNQSKAITIKGISYTWNGTEKIKWENISSTLSSAASGGALATLTLVKGEDALCDLGSKKGTSTTGKAGTWDIKNWQASSASTDAMVSYITTAANSGESMQLFLYVAEDNYTSNLKFFSNDVNSTTYNTKSNSYTYTSGTGWATTDTNNTSTRYAEIKKYVGYSEKSDDEFIAELKPQLTITLETPAAATGKVVNQTKNIGYDTFDAAVSAAASGDVLVLNEDVTIGARIGNAKYGGSSEVSKSLTIVAGKDNVTLTRGVDDLLFNANNISLTIGSSDHPLILDMNNSSATSKIYFEAASSNGKLTLTNVTIKNANTTHANGLINVKDNAGSLILDGVTFDNCTASVANSGIVFLQKEVLTLKNAIAFNNCSGSNFYLKKAVTLGEGFSATGLTIGVDVTSLPVGNTIINNVTSAETLASQFSLVNTGYQLYYNDSKAVLATVDYSKTFKVDGVGSYETLADALTNVTDGGTILVQGNATVNAQVSFDKNVTIKAAESVTPVLTRGVTDKSLYVLSGSKTVTFDGITFDEASSTAKPLMETNTNHHIVLKDVTIQNSKYSGTDGLLDVKNGDITFQGVTFKDCALTNAYIRTAVSSGVKIAESTTVTFNNSTGNQFLLRANGSIDGGAVLAAFPNPVTVLILVSDISKLSISNVESETAAGNFTLANEGYEMNYDADGKKITFSEKTYDYSKTWKVTGVGSWDSLEDAMTNVSDNGTIYLTKDTEISSTVTFSKPVTIAAETEARTIKRATELGDKTMFDVAGKTVTIGSSEVALTIDGQSTASTKALAEVTTGTLNFVNTTIKDLVTSNKQGVLCAKTNGTIGLNGVTFSGCKATAENAGIVFCGKNDGIQLQGANGFTGCTGYDFALENRIKVVGSLTAPTGGHSLYLTLTKFTGDTPTIIVYNPTSSYATGQFTIANPGYQLASALSNQDLKMQKITYNVTVGTITGGTVTVDKSTATVGETITITTTATGTNFLTGLPTAVYGTENTAVTVEATEDGKYTFVMPAADVTVGATFAAKATGNVVNETQNTGYDSFMAAYEAAATGDVLVLNANTEITGRIGSVTTDGTTTKKSLTIKAGKAGVSLTRGADAKGMLFNADGVTLNIGSADYQLIIDGNNVESSAGLFELGQTTTSVLTLTNVVVKNVKTTSPNGIINIKKGCGGVTLTDVTFQDNTVSNALIRTLDVNTGGMTFGGTLTVSGGTGDLLRLGSGAVVDATTLPTLDSYTIEIEDATPTITNVADATAAAMFVLSGIGYEKKYEGTTISFVQLSDGQDTAIDESTVADGYQLTGVTVSADGYVREDAAGNAYGTGTDMEVKAVDGKNFYGFVKIDLPDDAVAAGAEIAKAQLRLVTELAQGTGWFKLYDFTDTYVETSKYNDLSSAITATLAKEPLHTIKVKGEQNKSVNKDAVGDDYKTIDKWTNLIDLTSYVKSKKSAGTMTLMIVAGTSEDKKNAFFTREATDFTNEAASITVKQADIVPQLNLVYKPGNVPLSVTHPAMLHTADDIARVKGNLGLSPIREAYEHLRQSSYAQASYKASAVEYLKRMDATNWQATYPDYNNYTNAMKDAHAAYQLALRYRLSGDEQFATTAVKILNDWASTNKGLLKTAGYANNIPDPNEYLILIQGHQFANAAELLRDYSGWQAEDFTAFKSWMKTTFSDNAKLFLENHHNNANKFHYWLNWDLAAMTTMLSVGILCEDKGMTDYAINYYKGTAHSKANGTGYVENAIPFVFAEDGTIGLGQCQESGRDQGHSLLDVALLGAFCQMAKNIGTDLFKEDDYRALKMAEYVGKYNLGNDVPFTAYTAPAEADHQSTAVSAEGRGGVRPVWELFFRYAKDNSKTLKYTEQWVEKLRSANTYGEGGGGDYGSDSNGFDQLGYGTLMYADPDDATGQDDEITTIPTGYSKSERGAEGDTYVRSDNAEAKNGSAQQMEVRTGSSAGFTGLVSFKLPAGAVSTGAEIQKVQLRLVTKRKKNNSNINLYPYVTFDEATATYTTEGSAVTTAKASAPIATFKPKGQYNMDVTTDATKADYAEGSKTLEAWTNRIDLTKYVKGLTGREVSLLIADANDSDDQPVQFFTKERTEGLAAATSGFDAEASDIVPQLIVIYKGSDGGKAFVIENEGSFATLAEALDEVADGGTILVAEDATIDSQVTFSKNVTIKPQGSAAKTLKRNSDNKEVLYKMDKNVTVTFENLVLDENHTTEKPLLEVNNTQKFVLNNVTIQNADYANADGLMDVKNGTLTLNGVTFKDCDVANAYIRTAKADGGGLDLTGKVSFTGSKGDYIRLRGNASIDGASVLKAFTAPVTIQINGADYEKLSITNVTDLTKFQLTTDGYVMTLDGTTVKFTKEPDGQDTDDLTKYDGQTSERSADGDTFVRKTSSATNYGKSTNIEVHTSASGANDFAGLLSFTLPAGAKAEGAEIQKVQLRLVTKQKKSTGGINLYETADFSETEATYDNTTEALTAARGTKVLAKFYPNGQYNMDVTSDGGKEAFSDDYRKLSAWENRIDLTDYVKQLDGRKVNLLLSASSTDDGALQFFSKEWTTDLSTAAGSDGTASAHALNATAADLPPQLIVIYKGVTQTNTFVIEDSGDSYATLEEALAEVADGGTILVTKDAVISSQVTFSKNVTIKSQGTELRTLSRDSEAATVLYKADKNVHVTFENIVLDEDGATAKPLLEVSNSQHFTLKNVMVQNSKYQGTDGLLDVKNGKLTLDNVTFKNCSLADAFIRTAVTNGGGLELTDEVTFENSTGTHFRLRGSASIDAASVLSVIDAPVRIQINGADYEKLSITNASSLSDFELETDGYVMTLKDGTITFTTEPDGQDKDDLSKYSGTTSTRTPDGDTFVRKSSSGSNYGKATNVEIHMDASGDNDFAGLLSFNLPVGAVSEKAEIQKVQLRLVTKQKKSMGGINIFGGFDFAEDKATYENTAESLEKVRTQQPIIKFYPNGQYNMDVTSDGGKETFSSDYRNLNAWVNLIDLTDYVKKLGTRKVNLLLSASSTDNGSLQFFSKEWTTDLSTAAKSDGSASGNAFNTAAADLTPQLIVIYKGDGSTGNFIIDNGDAFATLEEALAEVTDGGTIQVAANATIDEQVTFSKNVTIKSQGSSLRTLTRKGGLNKVLFRMDKNVHVTFEDIILNDNQSKEKPLLEVNNSQHFTLKNVTIQNSRYANADGLLDVKNGTLTLNGVTFSNCAVSNAFIRTAKANGGGLDLPGKVSFSGCSGDYIRLRANASINGAAVVKAFGAPVTIEINGADYSKLSITNVSDAGQFRLTTDGYEMSFSQNTITFRQAADGQDRDDLSLYDGKTSERTPDGDTFVRKTNSDTNYGKATNMEIHMDADGSNDFAGLLSFRLPTVALAEDAEIEKVQLRLVTKQKKSTGGINLYPVCDFDEGTATYTNMTDSIAKARRQSPIAKFYPKGQTNMDVTSDGSKEAFGSDYRNLAAWENRIDLTDYVKGLGSSKVNLLLSASSTDNGSLQFFTKEWTTDLSTAAKSDGTPSGNAFNTVASDLTPKLIVIYKGGATDGIFIVEDEGSFDTLEEALEAAPDGGTIIVTADAVVDSLITFTKSVTIKSDSKPAHTLTRGDDQNGVLYKMGKSVTVTFEDIVLDEGNQSEKPLLEVSTNQHFVLKDVTIQNSQYKNADGLLDVKNGTLTLDNVTFKDCSVANAFIRTAKADGGGLEFVGKVTFDNSTGDHIRLRANASIDGTAVADAIGAPVSIQINGADYENLSVTNVTDASLFRLTTIGYSMHYEDGVITFIEEGDGQDTEPIVVPEGAVKVAASSLVDTYVRKGNASSNGNKKNMEVYTYADEANDLDFVAMMSFKLPNDLVKEGARLYKAQLRLVSKRVKGSRIVDMYDLYRDFDEGIIYDQAEPMLDEARSYGPYHRFHARGEAGMDIEADSAKLSDEYRNIEAWTNLIDMTDFVEKAMHDDGKIRFAMTSPLNSRDAKMFYTKETDSIMNSMMFVSADLLVPQLVLVYEPGTGGSLLTARNINTAPVADTFVKKGSSNDNSISTCIEVYTYQDSKSDIDLVGLLSFNLNEEAQMARARTRSGELEVFSATLRLVTKRVRGDRNMNVYPFTAPFGSASTYADLEDAIKETRESAKYVTFKTAGQSGKDITTDTGLTGEFKTSIAAWTNEIDLTEIFRDSDSGVLRLMLSAPANARSSKQYFSSKAESFTNDNNKDFIVGEDELIPMLTISYRNPQYTTDMEEVIEIPLSDSRVIYDLRGNRVENMGKGVYIMDGKKVFNK